MSSVYYNTDQASFSRHTIHKKRRVLICVCMQCAQHYDGVWKIAKLKPFGTKVCVSVCCKDMRSLQHACVILNAEWRTSDECDVPTY